MKYFASYYDGIGKGAIPSDAAIQSMSNTLVNAIINVAGEAAGGVGAALILPAIGISSPFVIVLGVVGSSVWAGNQLQKYMTEKGTTRNEVVQNIKGAMSNTIKNTYNTIKGKQSK